jgi:CRP/FNR family cyclic AMP-dependent transcriptional regulator
MNVSFADALAYMAALLVFLTFSMKTMVPLRIASICSNLFFVACGYFAPAYPILILHAALLPLNLFRLQQMLTLVRQIGDATAGDLNMEWLKPFTTKRMVKAGETLFRKGDKADSMYFVVSGEFKVAELGISLGPNQVLGELGLLAPNQIRTQSIECVKDADTLRITYDQVRQLYFQNPKFGFYFLQLTSRRLFENIARLEKRLAEKSA